MKKIILFVIALIYILAFSPVQVKAEGWKKLQLNDKTYEVYALKLLLRNKDYDPGELSTVFNDQTYSSLVSFQKDYGLKPDGKAGQETWSKLIAPVGKSGFANEMDDAVKAVQYLLRKKYAFSSLEASGYFNQETRAAILLFQYNYKLGTNGTNGVDGIVNKKTWMHLIRDSKKSNNYKWVIDIELNRDRNVLGTLSVFDAEINWLAKMLCLGESMTMNENWREVYGNTPLGCFKATVSNRERNSFEYGDYYCIELSDNDVKAVTNGRDGILIHSGSNNYKNKSDSKLPKEYRDSRAKTINGLDQTHGCVRIYGEDHKILYELLKDSRQGIVYISEIE